MPDPAKATVSATQSPALFGVSPYLTRWMLARHFIHGDPIDSPEHERMTWGTKLQPLILEQAAEELHLEVRPNVEYVRSELVPIGCTRDAEIICPDRGPGALETKCVFDYRVWMQNWNGGKALPKHNEIQIQHQMMVGDGRTRYGWGVLAVWVCGEVKYFERQPIPEIWEAIEQEAGKFFADVRANREGEPFGQPVEFPLLARLFEPEPGKVADFTAHVDATALAEKVRMLDWHRTERSSHARGEEKLKAELLALMKDAEVGMFVGGIKLERKLSKRAGYTVKPTVSTSLKAYIPEELPDELVA